MVLVHCWFVEPVQVHWMIAAPSAVLPLLTSRHFPLCRATSCT